LGSKSGFTDTAASKPGRWRFPGPASRCAARRFRAPLSAAKYVQFETFLDKKTAPGQRSFVPWPYIEGLTMAEAGQRPRLHRDRRLRQAARQGSGRPEPLACPWKYGFKSIKSIVRLSFVDQRPKTFCEMSGPEEYGFWANVNPDAPHPRWSQARENFLNDGSQRPTMLFNGYGDEVASLYKGLEPLYM